MMRKGSNKLIILMVLAAIIITLCGSCSVGYQGLEVNTCCNCDEID